MANSTQLMLCQSLFFIILLAISPRPPSWSSPNLPGRQNKGCNRKVTLLVSELFQGWEGCSKRSLLLRTQLHKMQHGSKTDLLIEKKLCDFDWIISLPNVGNRAKICQGSAEFLWWLVHFLRMKALNSKHCCWTNDNCLVFKCETGILGNCLVLKCQTGIVAIVLSSNVKQVSWAIVLTWNVKQVSWAIVLSSNVKQVSWAIVLSWNVKQVSWTIVLSSNVKHVSWAIVLSWNVKQVSWAIVLSWNVKHVSWAIVLSSNVKQVS